MATPTVLQGDVFVNGSLNANNLVPSDNAVTDSKVAQPAIGGVFIAKEKLEQGILRTASQTGTAATERKIVHIAKGPGYLELVKICSIVAPLGAATVTFVILKNNSVAMLTGTLKLDNTSVAFTPQSGTVSGVAYAAGDVFDLAITATAGGGTLPSGIFCQMLFKEDPIG